MALAQGNDNEDEPALAKGALTKHVSDLVQSTRRKFTLSDILDDKVAVLDVLTSSHTDSHGVDDDPTTMPRDPREEECGGQRHVAFRQLWERHASSSPGIQFLIDIEELQRTEQDTSTSDWPVDALNAVVDQLYMGITTSSPTLMLIATRILAKALRWKRNQAVVLRRHVDFLLHVGRAMQTWIESTSSPDDSNAVAMAEEALQHWTTMMEVCLVGSCAVWAAWTDIGMLSVSEAATSRSRPDEAASNHQHADAERQCVDTMDYINHREYSARTTNDSTSSGADFAVMDQYLMMPPFVATVPSVVRCITHVLQQTRTHQLCPVFLPLQLRLLTLVGSLCCVHRSLAITTALDLLDDAALTTLFDLLLIPTKDVTSVRRLIEEAQFARLVVAVAVEACEAARRPQWPLVAEKLSLLTLTFRWIQDQAMKVAASTASSSSQRTTHDDQPWAVTDIPLHDMLSWEGESSLQVMEDERLFASCATCQAHTAQWDVAGLVASCPSLSCCWNPDEAMATVAAVFESASRCYKALFDGLFLAFVCPSTTSTTTTDDSSTSPTHAFLEHIVMVSLDILNASRTTLHGLSVELHAAMFLRRLFHVNPASMIVPNVLRTVHAWGFLLHHPELFGQAESTEGGGMGQLVRRGEGADGEDVRVFSLTGGDSRRRHAATRTHVYTHTLLSSLFVAVVDSSEDKAAILSQVTDAVVQHQQNVRFVYSISRTLDHLARQPHLHSVVYSPSNFASLVAVLTSSSSSIPDSKTALHWVTMLSLLRLVHRHVTADMATANAVLHCEFTSAQRPPLVPTTSTPPYPPQRLLPCLFALLRLRPCVPMVLEMLLMLLKSATVLMFGQSDRHPEATSARLFDFLHAHVFHAFMQTMSELVSYVPHSTTNRVGQDDGIEATVASMVTCVGQLFSFHAAASCKDLQVLFRACNAFVHLTNLLHSPRFVQPRSRHIQITRQVCHVLTLLMARNRDSKAEFRTLMASTASDHERVAYEPLVHVFLAAEDGTPSWESMQVMWNMLVDNESSNSSSSDRIRNPDVIPVLFCLFRHCSPHDQVRFLCQFKRLFRPSSHDSLNRSMCCYVQPGTMDQLLDALEGGLHSLPDLADLVAEIGWHSVGVRQLKRMFRLLQAAPALMAPLVDALYYMVQRHVVDQPSRFFFFDGDQSGLELAPFNVPAKGFTFHTWLLRLEQVSLGPQDSCIYSWLDQHFHGYALMLRNGRIEYHTQTNVWPTTIQLESNTCYNPSVWEGQYFLDSSCNFQDTDPLHSAARRLDGTYHIFTRSAVDVLECIGGIAVLFPLFAQFDTQSSHDLTANVLKLLCAVLRANAANQRYMTDHHGFLVTGYLLSRVSPHHMTLQALNAMHVFVLGDDESRPFQAQALRFWLADFALWVFTPVDVQIHVVKILHRLVTDSQKSVWPAVLTVRKVLDDLRLYYWFTPPSLVWQQEATDREATVGTIMEGGGGHDDALPSLFEVPGSAFSKQEWIHPETKCRVATHLQPGDRLLVRAELWKLVEIICRQKDTDLDQEDVSALCGFLAFSGDECQKVDLLMLLRRLLTTSPLAFRHHLIRLVGEEAQKLAGPSSPLTDDFCPSSAFGSPIQAHDLLFALVLRRPNVTIPVKLLAFELLVEVFTYNSQWPAKTTTPPHTPHLPSSSVYLLCAMDYIEDSYNDLARLCFRLLLGSPTVAKSAEPPQPPPSSSLVIQNPCVLPSLLTTLLVCDASLCLEIVQDLTQLLGRHKARNNASLFKPFSRLVVLLLLRFSDSADVDRCVNLLGTLVVSQLQTEEDGWCVHHAISSSIKRLVASPALSYTLRCHVIVYVVQHLSAEHATSSPRQPSPLVNKASKWQYLSPDSERQKWYIFYSNVWYLVFAMEIDLCDTGPEPFAWSVATAVVALLQRPYENA
ncbi:hypothetical protein DYB36_008718 [Aphanomyces astaci]|uniref:Uncharacterized protein n=1 Tax=Aphanomyces astaci TaxID=112090 RepID=A0A397BLL0_APHAT|nr:hypothetical protein DYB36_008718 [Aphanomyces astaci]